jgi:hypothetical protein
VPAWARPVPHQQAGTGTDPEAGWGHRNVGRSIEEGEMFSGYLLSAIIMVADEHGPAVPELARRITAGTPSRDPPAALAAVLVAMAASGIALGDVLADPGYAHRLPATWASPLRAAGAELVQDLHPCDRGPQGTHQGSIIANGNLYCPQTPGPLLELIPLPPGASAAEVAAHDQQTAELARYKLGLHAAQDADGYRRHACPAAMGKIRCPLRPESMKLDRSRPEVINSPGHPQPCCTQHTITVPGDQGRVEPPTFRFSGLSTTVQARACRSFCGVQRLLVPCNGLTCTDVDETRTETPARRVPSDRRAGHRRQRSC